jgi:pyruvate/2-oxoglutarate dehydrogenase complex dihydrolipoamide dehydrogenase (E3) component
MQRHDPVVAGEPGSGASGQAAPEEISCDLCIIGAGSGGLSVAAAAAAFGEKVVLIERHRMGGDCLNYGCVPSKALIAAARRAHLMRTSAPFGIRPVTPQIDHRAVHDHVHGVIAAIAPNDSVERFTGMGVRLIEAEGRFLDRETVAAGSARIKARRFVIATGSAAVVPPIPGLDRVPYLTNESIFDNAEPIEHLVVVGGGPIGIELAQAHLRLGSRVTVLEGMKALGKDDPELAAHVLEAVRREGLVIREGTLVQSVEGHAGALRVTVRSGEAIDVVEGTHLLIAAGRRPNLSGLDLDKAGIEHERTGIKVDSGLVTSNPKVFAIGDCVGGLQFTHVANYHAGIVIRRALFRMPAKVDTSRVPWVTYTDPELAHVGLTEAQARQAGHKVSILRWPFHENDRAQAEREAHGHVKVVVGARGRILGASIVGPHAGEIIQQWSLAIAQGLKIKAMTDWISPYPTLAEVNKRAAIRYYASATTSPMVRRAIGWLKRLG